MTHPRTWRETLSRDIQSGFIVFLLALPLSLAIAKASDFPPTAGLLTAIVGGLVATHFGAARLAIKGPAAGLIVIAIGAVAELGQGDPVTGYRRALAVGVAAAVLQIVFAILRFATIGIAMSPSVVHGMLAAIGVIIISKQIHPLLGVIPTAKEPLELLAEVPHSIAHANPEVAIVGVLSIAILFVLPSIRSRWARLVPAPIIVLAFAIPASRLLDLRHDHDYLFMSVVHHLGPSFLLQLPGALLDAVVFPDFSVVFSAISIKYIVMFALIGTIESTLTVLAVDAMDPERRASKLNRDLLAIGIGNLVAALIGGLPMISEIVRSKANVDAGAASRWSNAFHGLFLLVLVVAVPGLLGEIPLCALAALLVYTGLRLASPKEFLHVREIGRDQLALFLTTALVTIATDLLLGVFVGLLLELVLHRLRGASARSLFFTRIERSEHGKEVRLSLHGAAAFTSLLRLRRRVGTLPPSIERVTLDLTDVILADHTFLNRVNAMANEWPHARLEIIGVETLDPVSAHPHATRCRRLA